MTDALNTYFMTGEFSNPVLRLKPIMEFMDKKNIQKPVMISECGTPHFIRTENEDTTNWANLQLKRLYGEVIRVYPNIKMMSYFNVDIKSEPNVYALYNNETLNNTYNELVSTPYFLSNLEDEANFGYKPFVGGEYFNDEIIKLSAFAYYPKEFYNEVRYVVDGNLVYATSNPPYELNLDTATIGSGNHTLGVELYAADKKLIEKQLPINIVPNIKVEVNGNKVAFKDQKPVIIDGRTLVPVRGVFENLGMTVEWVQSEQKVILTRKDTTISLLIGKDELTITTLNGTKSIKMDVPAQLINNRTMVPVRAISEAANAKVDWDSNLQTVLVKTN
jgi:hypothetical protein